MDVAHLGPGAYVGNELTFGKKVSHDVKISPKRKYYERPPEYTPGPGNYNTERGH